MGCVSYFMQLLSTFAFDDCNVCGSQNVHALPLQITLYLFSLGCFYNTIFCALVGFAGFLIGLRDHRCHVE